MRITLSLRARLAVGLTLAMGLVWILAMIASAVTLSGEIEELSESVLALSAERLLPLAMAEVERGALTPGGAAGGAAGAPVLLSALKQGDDALVWVLRRVPEGVLVIQPERLDSDLLSAPLVEGFSVTDHFVVYTHLSEGGAYAVQVAEGLDGRDEAIRETLQAMAAPLLVLLLPLSLYFVMWVSKRALRPVASLSAEVAGRDARDLTPLGAMGLPVELRPIREAVDALMGRLRRALEAEQAFAANAAHEMRTPIAATLAQTQRLVAEAPEGPLKARAQTIERELSRVARVTEKLLELARADGGGVVRAERVDLVPIVRAVVAEVAGAEAMDGGALRGGLVREGGGARGAETGRERWVLRLPEGFECFLDPDAFGLLLGNLVLNAARHGDRAQAVVIELTPQGLLTLSNGGAVIAPDELARLPTRFERGGAVAAGSGLGLAIASSIARGARVPLTLLSPAPGRADGFCARVDLHTLM